MFDLIGWWMALLIAKFLYFFPEELILSFELFDFHP